MFLYAQNEGEFASVLAHELAHLSQRHFARGLEARQQMQIPMMAAMLGGIIASQAPRASGYGGGNSCRRWNYQCSNGAGWACRNLDRYC